MKMIKFILKFFKRKRKSCWYCKYDNYYHCIKYDIPLSSTSITKRYCKKFKRNSKV